MRKFIEAGSAGAWRAGSRHRIGERAESHHCRRRRRLPVLSADDAGRAARRIQEGRRQGGTRQFQGRLAGVAPPCSAAAPMWCPAISTTASISRPRTRRLQAFVVYDRYPGFALVVSPKNTERLPRSRISPARRSASARPVRRPISSSSTCWRKNGVDPNSIGVIGIGLEATAVAAMEHGHGRRRDHARPGDHLAAGQVQGPENPCDTRTQKDTVDVFGGEYPGGALYTSADWIAKNRKDDAGADQRHRCHAEVDSSPLAGRDHGENAGGAGRRRTRRSIWRRSRTRCRCIRRPAGWTPRARKPCSRYSASRSPEVAKANIDLSKTYTNTFVEQANAKTGMLAK